VWVLPGKWAHHNKLLQFKYNKIGTEYAISLTQAMVE
jgi:hypothetical protein